MRASDPPIIVEQTYACSIRDLWCALTEHHQMLKWYFDNIPDFQPAVGFTTKFSVKSGGRTFTHFWEIKEVRGPYLISHTWTYEEYPGSGLVEFHLSGDDKHSVLKLVLETKNDFPEDIPEFERENCIAGWEYFLGERLGDYLLAKSNS